MRLRGVRYVCVMLAAPSVCLGAVDLVLLAPDHDPAVARVFEVSLIATTDSGVNEPISAMDVVLAWDPGALTLLEVDTSSGGPFLSAGFPSNDPFGLNEADPPADGDALFTALSQFANPFEATPEGALVAIFVFQADAPGQTIVDILPSGGDPPISTKVLGTGGPNQNILGQTFPAVVTIAGSCPADLTGDGLINSADLNVLLAAFGVTSAGDINGDRTTDSLDLNLLLADFGEDCL